MAPRVLSPVVVGLPGCAERTIIRCLHGPQPEHRARRLTACVLRRAGASCDVSDAETAVNELVTNARQHAPGPYELRIYIAPAGVKVAVMDSGGDHIALTRRLAQAATADAFDGESGRGLQIVTGLFPGSWGAEAVASCTGLTPAKQVWISVPRRPSPPPSRPAIPSGLRRPCEDSP